MRDWNWMTLSDSNILLLLFFEYPNQSVLIVNSTLLFVRACGLANFVFTNLSLVPKEFISINKSFPFQRNHKLNRWNKYFTWRCFPFNAYYPLIHATAAYHTIFTQHSGISASTRSSIKVLLEMVQPPAPSPLRPLAALSPKQCFQNRELPRHAKITYYYPTYFFQINIQHSLAGSVIFPLILSQNIFIWTSIWGTLSMPYFGQNTLPDENK